AGSNWGAVQERASTDPPLVLVSQTPWVTAAQPWFNIALGVTPSDGPASGLRVDLTFYGRLDDASQLQQSISGTPSTTPLLHDDGVPVEAGIGGLTASACVTVEANDSASPPSSGSGICAANTPTLT